MAFCDLGSGFDPGEAAAANGDVPYGPEPVKPDELPRVHARCAIWSVGSPILGDLRFERAGPISRQEPRKLSVSGLNSVDPQSPGVAAMNGRGREWTMLRPKR